MHREIITLTENSKPAFHALKNTGAGIKFRETFASVAKIRVRQKPGFPELEHVELIFGDEKVVLSEPPKSLDRARTTSRMSESEPTHMGRGESWTFPLSYNRLYAQPDIEREPSPNLRERLIRRDDAAKDTKDDAIYIDSLYG